MIYFAILLSAFGLALLWLVRRRQKTSGLPAGRIIYTDVHAWQKVEKVLYDSETGLAGKPDYLVKKDDQIIPIEVKSGIATEHPHDSHIFQLAAYCWLVKITYGKRPPYGIVHYANQSYAIDFTPALEKNLLEKLEEMRQRERQAGVDRSHQSPHRCQACGYRSICDQNLVYVD